MNFRLYRGAGWYRFPGHMPTDAFPVIPELSEPAPLRVAGLFFCL